MKQKQADRKTQSVHAGKRRPCLPVFSDDGIITAAILYSYFLQCLRRDSRDVTSASIDRLTVPTRIKIPQENLPSQ